MKAREIMVNIPIQISIDGDGKVSVDGQSDDAVAADDEIDATDGQHSPLESPLDQELELRKAELGKQSKFIDRMIKGDKEE